MTNIDSSTRFEGGLGVQLDLPPRVITARGELDLAGSSALAEVMARLIERTPGTPPWTCRG